MARRERLERLPDRIQMWCDLIQQALPFRRDPHTAWLAQQQRIAEALLQLPHLGLRALTVRFTVSAARVRLPELIVNSIQVEIGA
ncbi:hypothetical protein HDC96_000659 [Stenotrophomonas sp. JAI102]|nr:hypothetical protein [Stenotrophomonas sp. JAI102]